MSGPADIPTRYRPPAGVLRWLIRALALCGLLLSAFLVYESLTSAALPGCGPGSGCDEVLHSPWSKVFGIPVAAPAVLVYLFILSNSMNLTRRGAWRVLIGCAFILIFAAGYFTAVQVALIGALCKYCLAAHVIGVLLAFVLLAAAPIGRARLLPDEAADPMMIPSPAVCGLAALALAPVALLVGIQYAFPAPTTGVDRGVGIDFDTGPGPDRRISVLGGRVRIEPHQYPSLGSPDAPVLVLKLFDFTCPHCQRMHGQLKAARSRYGDPLAIIMLPAPLDADCNPSVRHTEQRHEHACELAKLALAVWKADPLQFEAFADWLFEDDNPPAPQIARDRAEILVGSGALSDALDGPSVTEQITRNVTLYRMTGGALPQLIVGSALIRGRPQTPEELYGLLETETSLKPASP